MHFRGLFSSDSDQFMSVSANKRVLLFKGDIGDPATGD